MRNKFIFSLIVTTWLTLSGCAIHYYDPETQTEHLYGLGHMAMRASYPNGNLKSIVKGTEIVGIGLGNNEDGGYFSLGWDKRRRIEIVDENTTIDLKWTNEDFFNTRIGSSFPKESAANKQY